MSDIGPSSSISFATNALANFFLARFFFKFFLGSMNVLLGPDSDHSRKNERKIICYLALGSLVRGEGVWTRAAKTT